MKKGSSSIESKLSIITFVFLIVLALVVGTISLVIYRGDLIDNSGDRVLSIARIVAAEIDGDTFEQLATSGERTEYIDKLQAFANQVYTENNIIYLYALYNINNTDVTYFIDAYDDSYEDPLFFGEKESSSDHNDLVFETYRTGKPSMTDAYGSDEYGTVISGYAPIKTSNGKVVGVVGADIGIDFINKNVWTFGAQILITALVLSLVFGLVVLYVIKRMIGRPIKMLTECSDKLAHGEVEIDLEVTSNDEIGRLTESFLYLASSTKKQVEAMQQIAEGNYDFDIEPESNRDLLNVALKTVLDENNKVFTSVQDIASRVAAEASQIASGAQSLAQGSTEQASSTEELASAISEVLEQTKDNAQNAKDALEIVGEAGDMMQGSMQYMQQMQDAMNSIADSSENITKIIKTIDDIAFNTNILALNASVEAARAGQHGRGFAVVAEEVRNLASQSAQAAKETAALIQTSADQVVRGSQIVRETSSSIQNVAISAQKTQEKIVQINDAAQSQEKAIEQINIGVSQISQVVQMNSATSQQSAAMSQEMSDQANALSQITGKFQLRDGEKLLSSGNYAGRY